MVIEHEFVTTLEAEDAMRRVGDFLLSRGFENSRESAFQVSGGRGGSAPATWTRIRATRGKKKPTHVRRFDELPQTAIVSYDRGRVEVALSVRTVRDKIKPEYERVATALARAVEDAVCEGPEVAARRLDLAEGMANVYLARDRRKYYLILYVILGLIALGFAALFAAAVFLD